MAKNIKGNRDGLNNRNETYTIQGRGVISKNQVVKETNQGKHPNHFVTKINGNEYIKSKPNKNIDDNVNKGK